MSVLHAVQVCSTVDGQGSGADTVPVGGAPAVRSEISGLFGSLALSADERVVRCLYYIR